MIINCKRYSHVSADYTINYQHKRFFPLLPLIPPPNNRPLLWYVFGSWDSAMEKGHRCQVILICTPPFSGQKGRWICSDAGKKELSDDFGGEQ